MMKDVSIIRAAIVGCGNIAKTYAEQMQSYPQVEITGFADIDKERAKALASEHGSRAYTDPEEAYADENVDLIVNLTIHNAHYQVIKAALNAGKHVYTEKPFASNVDEASKLIDIAERNGLSLVSAPIVYLGEAQQVAWKKLEAKELGEVRLAYAEINHGRIESWHPNPVPFYEIGVLNDVAIYPITLATAYLGPISKVTAFSRVLKSQRFTQEGKPFTITTPDYFQAHLELECGTLLRLTANFYALDSEQGSSIEFHGDKGSLLLESSFLFNASISRKLEDSDKEAVPCPKNAFQGVEFARGVRWMASQLLEGKMSSHAANHAKHVLEALSAITESAKTGHSVDMTTSFDSQMIEWKSD